MPLSVINPVTYFAGVTSKAKFIALLLFGYIKTFLISLFSSIPSTWDNSSEFLSSIGISFESCISQSIVELGSAT